MTNAQSIPVLSIVIPTRNRYATLNVIVNQFLEWPSGDFELVIEDNSEDASGFSEVLSRYGGDPRLSYRHDTSPRSAPENCDRAIERARGQVVTFIGDDDSVTIMCIEAARWMVMNRIDAIVCGLGAYTWPDMEHAVSLNNAYNGKLTMLDASGSITALEVDSELSALAAAGAQKMGRIPRLYQALVQRHVLDRMRAELGTVFPGPVPDMANAVAMAKFIGHAVWADVPLVVAGQSKSSMSGKNSVRKHQGALQEERSLPADTAVTWSPAVPRYWSAPTIWAQAAIRAAQQTGKTEFLERFDYARLYASCLAFNHRSYYPHIVSAMLSHGVVAQILLVPTVGWHLFRITLTRLATLSKKMAAGVPGEIFDDVSQATHHVEFMIERRKLMANFRTTPAGSEGQQCV